MNKANTEIRRAAKRAGVSLGDIAQAINCDESKLTRWLRDGLPANVKPKIMDFLAGKQATKQIALFEEVQE